MSDGISEIYNPSKCSLHPVVQKLVDENAQLKEKLAQATAREARLRASLESIAKIRFLLGNDPRLNPAYEMGAIAQRALEEAGTCTMKNR